MCKNYVSDVTEGKQWMFPEIRARRYQTTTRWSHPKIEGAWGKLLVKSSRTNRRSQCDVVYHRQVSDSAASPGTREPRLPWTSGTEGRWTQQRGCGRTIAGNG